MAKPGKRKYSRKPESHMRIARERILELFRQAELSSKDEPNLSKRYVEMALKLSMRYKSRIPKELRRKFCSKCHSYLVPGASCTVRTHSGKVVYHCNICKSMMRFRYR